MAGAAGSREQRTNHTLTKHQPDTNRTPTGDQPNTNTAWSSRETGAGRRGIARNSRETPGNARSRREQPGDAGRRRATPGDAGKRGESPGAAGRRLPMTRPLDQPGLSSEGGGGNSREHALVTPLPAQAGPSSEGGWREQPGAAGRRRGRWETPGNAGSSRETLGDAAGNAGRRRERPGAAGSSRAHGTPTCSTRAVK